MDYVTVQTQMESSASSYHPVLVARWCITRVTPVCDMVRYRLVHDQERKIWKKNPAKIKARITSVAVRQQPLFSWRT